MVLHTHCAAVTFMVNFPRWRSIRFDLILIVVCKSFAVDDWLKSGTRRRHQTVGLCPGDVLLFTAAVLTSCSLIGLFWSVHNRFALYNIRKIQPHLSE